MYFKVFIETPGRLLAIDLDTKEINPASDSIGNVDGLVPDGTGGWLVTDWIVGALHRIASDGTSEQPWISAKAARTSSTCRSAMSRSSR